MKNQKILFFLYKLRRAYIKLFGDKPFPYRITDCDESNEVIYKMLMSKEPCMIARFGGVEMDCAINYIGVHDKKWNILKYVKGDTGLPQWSDLIIEKANRMAGLFPADIPTTSKFAELIFADAKEADMLGTMHPKECLLWPFENNPKRCLLSRLEPWLSKKPWTRALAGKKVLIVHPWVTLIEKQYREKREKLFTSPDMLPQFEIKTVQAVVSYPGEEPPFKDWFEALEYMKSEIDKQDYDIAIIGCGAYGFHLAAHVKRQGKKAFHFGGATQILFGIIGSRWEIPNQHVEILGPNSYRSLFNEYWVRPGEQERPKNFKTVGDGGACYW